MANTKYWSTRKTTKEGVFRATHTDGSTAWLIRVRRRDWKGKRHSRERILSADLTLEEAALERAQLAVDLEKELTAGDGAVEDVTATVPNRSARSVTLWTFCADVYRTQHGLNPATWARERKYKVAGIMHDLGALELRAVTTPVVTAWQRRMATEGAPRKSGTRGRPLGVEARNDYLVALQAIFRIARDTGYIDAQPFTNRAAPVRMNADRAIWTRAMRKRLLDVAQVHDIDVYRLARFLLLTGCRPIEALRLKWTDIEEVPHRRLRLTGKGFRMRKLPLDGELGAFIDSVPVLGDAVFGVSRGPRKGQAFRYWPQARWERMCSKAKVPSAAYDLRHTFITEMVAAGVPLAKVALWCGNSVRVIEARYSHLAPDHLNEIAALAARSDPSIVEHDPASAATVTPARGDHLGRPHGAAG